MNKLTLLKEWNVAIFNSYVSLFYYVKELFGGDCNANSERECCL